jgi:hypothetical protein
MVGIGQLQDARAILDGHAGTQVVADGPIAATVPPIEGNRQTKPQTSADHPR